ncbi:MAG: metal ABC transporter permease [Acetobacteraceae bacterium]|nr:metal ABC transporter permease [Acetobacteraceae bacterium]
MDLIEPFLDFSFLRRALAGSIALALSAPPLGVFLVQRRLSLIGDALGHAILPGVGLGVALFGLSVVAMTAGGLIAGLAVMLAAGLLARGGPLREDASLAGFYLVALALGVAIVSWGPAQLDLLDLLFGSVLSVDDAALLLMAGTATLTLLSLAAMWRPLLIETFDAGFLRAQGGQGALWHLWFLALVVLNLVAAFQALGTLMAVGLMMLPALAARFLSPHLAGQVIASVGIAVLTVLGGLILSVQADVAAGPAIVLAAGALWLALLLAGPEASLLARSLRRPHLAR